MSNTPLREYKSRVYEGGIATPLVVSWPKGIQRREGWERQYGTVMDLMATCVELAGAKVPAKTEGMSLVPALEGRGVKRTADLLGAPGELGGARRAVEAGGQGGVGVV